MASWMMMVMVCVYIIFLMVPLLHSLDRKWFQIYDLSELCSQSSQPVRHRVISISQESTGEGILEIGK